MKHNPLPFDAVQLLAADKNVILYRPQYNPYTGSPIATLLLSQMAYWWGKMGNKPFYKFKETCTHDAYKEGQSWTEELGLTRREFDTALKYLEQRGFIRHKTDMNRLTWYALNTEAVERLVIALYTVPPQENVESTVKAESALTSGANSLYQRHKTPLVTAESAFRYTENTTETTTETTQQDAAQIQTENEPLKSSEVLPAVFDKPSKQDHNLVCENPEPLENDPVLIEGSNKKVIAEIMAKAGGLKKPTKLNVSQLVTLWKKEMAEYSEAFTGNLTQKEVGLLKHILKDYPDTCVALMEYVLRNWAAFGERVKVDKGLTHYPVAPNLAFLAAHRLLGQQVYLDSLKTPLNASYEASAPVALDSKEDFLSQFGA